MGKRVVTTDDVILAALPYLMRTKGFMPEFLDYIPIDVAKYRKRFLRRVRRAMRLP